MTLFSIDTPYYNGDQAILTSTHKLYQCTADNTLESPDVAVELTSPTWVEVSATNKYRAFDYTINTKAEHNSTVDTFIFTPGEPVTNIGFFGMSGVSVVYVQFMRMMLRVTLFITAVRV